MSASSHAHRAADATVGSDMIDSMISTWVSLVKHCERAQQERSDVDVNLLRRATYALAGDIDALLAEESGRTPG